MDNIPLFTGFYISQVVQDFFNQQKLKDTPATRLLRLPFGHVALESTSKVGLRIPSKCHSIQAKQTLRCGIQLPCFCLQLFCASLASSSCVSYRDAVINPKPNHSTAQAFLDKKWFENDLTPPNQ